MLPTLDTHDSFKVPRGLTDAASAVSLRSPNSTQMERTLLALSIYKAPLHIIDYKRPKL